MGTPERKNTNKNKNAILAKHYLCIQQTQWIITIWCNAERAADAVNLPNQIQYTLIIQMAFDNIYQTRHFGSLKKNTDANYRHIPAAAMKTHNYKNNNSKTFNSRRLLLFATKNCPHLAHQVMHSRMLHVAQSTVDTHTHEHTHFYINFQFFGCYVCPPCLGLRRPSSSFNIRTHRMVCALCMFTYSVWHNNN